MARKRALAVTGLRHVDDIRLPGLRRIATGRTLRIGKRHVPEFVIEDARGRRVGARRTLERIRRLAIPPAWSDVWICPFDNGHIQATGRDARGRKQYRYHARWRAERDRNKFEHLGAFGRSLPRLRRRIAADLRLPGLPRRKVVAAVVRLLETTLIRVGNGQYARLNHSYGLTTLENRHVDVSSSDEIRFHFRGKSGVAHRVAITDPRLARIVRQCRDLPGHELFEYVGDDGRIHAIDSADVNVYIHEAAGAAFTAKDFRTWAGTLLASIALRGGGEHAPSAPAARPSRRPRPGRSVAPAPRRAGTRLRLPSSGAARAARASAPTQREVVRAVREVAGHLGNTPSVCRRSYIHPAVISAYFGGTLGEGPPPARPQDASGDASGDAGGDASGERTDKLTALGRALTGMSENRARRHRPRPVPGLRPEEAAVLALLAAAS